MRLKHFLFELTFVACSHNTVVLKLQPTQRMVIGLFRLRFIVSQTELKKSKFKVAAVPYQHGRQKRGAILRVHRVNTFCAT